MRNALVDCGLANALPKGKQVRKTAAPTGRYMARYASCHVDLGSSDEKDDIFLRHEAVASSWYVDLMHGWYTMQNERSEKSAPNVQKVW